MHEGLGAVDRVDDPATAGPAGPVAEFLSDDGIVRETALYQLGDPSFRGAVGFGNGAIVRFFVNVHTGLKVPQGNAACLPGRVGAEGQEILERRLCHGRSFLCSAGYNTSVGLSAFARRN